MGMTCTLAPAPGAALAKIMIQPSAKAVRALVEADAALSLEKTWDGLHYLLTRCGEIAKHSLDFLKSATPLEGLDMGYGPPGIVSNREAKEIAAALARVKDEDLRSRFDPKDMLEEGVYPEIWDRDPKEDDTLGWLIDAMPGLRKFVEGCAGRGDGFLVVIQ